MKLAILKNSGFQKTNVRTKIGSNFVKKLYTIENFDLDPDGRNQPLVLWKCELH